MLPTNATLRKTTTNMITGLSSRLLGMLLAFLMILPLLSSAQSVNSDLLESVNSLVRLERNPDRRKAVIDSLENVVRLRGTEEEKILIQAEQAKWHQDNRQFEEAMRIYRTLYKVNTSGNDSAFIQKIGNAYVQLSLLFNMQQRPDSAVWALKNSLTLNERIGYMHGVAVNYNNLAGMYKSLGLTDSTLMYLGKGLKVVREIQDSIGIANYLIGLGVTYTDVGAYEKGIDYYLEAHEISQALGDQQLIDLSLGNLSVYYMLINDLNQARYYVEEHLAFADSVRVGYNDGTAAANAGMYYSMIDQKDSSLFFLNMSIARYDQTGFIPGKLRSMAQKADLLLETDRLSEALTLFQEILETSSGLYPGVSGRCLHGIARIYVRQNKPREAIALVDSALALADFKKIAINQLNQMYRTLYAAHKAIGDQAGALSYLEKVVQTKDSIISEETRMEIARIEYKNKLEREQAVFDLNQQNQALEYQATIDRSKSVRNSVLTVAFFSLVLLVLSVLSYRRTKKANVQLSQQAEELQKKNQALATLHEKEQALLKDNMEEKERRMVAITMTEHEKHGVLKKIDERLQVLTKKSDEVDSAELRGIRNLIKTNLDIDSSWDSFVHQFDQVNPTFFAKLRELYPDITTNDLKTCAYIKVGMDNKGIAQVTNASPNTIKSRIHRLKKKMNLNPDDNIRDILIAID